MSDTVKEQLLRGERAEKQVQSLLAIELSLRARIAELEAELATKSQAGFSALIDDLRHRIAELEADGPGTVKGRLIALCDYAVQYCGHNPLSARPPELAIYERIDKLCAKIEELKTEIAHDDETLDRADDHTEMLMQKIAELNDRIVELERRGQ